MLISPLNIKLGPVPVRVAVPPILAEYAIPNMRPLVSCEKPGGSGEEFICDLRVSEIVALLSLSLKKRKDLYRQTDRQTVSD